MHHTLAAWTWSSRPSLSCALASPIASRRLSLRSSIRVPAPHPAPYLHLWVDGRGNGSHISRRAAGGSRRLVARDVVLGRRTRSSARPRRLEFRPGRAIAPFTAGRSRSIRAFECRPTPQYLTPAARRYAEQLPPALDLLILGVGEDGHVCSLFPGHPALAVTDERVTVVEDAPKPPPRRMTLTMPYVLAARQSWVVAVGPRKAPVLRQALVRALVSTPLDLVVAQSLAVTVFTDQALRYVKVSSPRSRTAGNGQLTGNKTGNSSRNRLATLVSDIWQSPKLFNQRRPFQIQQPRRRRLVPAGSCQRAPDEITLHLFDERRQIDTAIRKVDSGRHRDLRRLNLGAVNRSLDRRCVRRAAQWPARWRSPAVARCLAMDTPSVGASLPATPCPAGRWTRSRVSESRRLTAFRDRYFCTKVLNEQRDVFPAIAQRRQLDLDDIQPIVEVLAEAAVLDHFRQVGVGRGHHSHVHFDRLAVADALELALLEHAQQLHLQRHGHRPHFIEEQRALVRLFEPTLTRADGAGERAAHVAEELRFEQTSGIALQLSATKRCGRRGLV